MSTRSCTCTACRALLDEAGAELFPLYAKKLLQRGWAGQLSPVERAYRRKHSSAAQNAAKNLPMGSRFKSTGTAA